MFYRNALKVVVLLIALYVELVLSTQLYLGAIRPAAAVLWVVLLLWPAEEQVYKLLLTLVASSLYGLFLQQNLANLALTGLCVGLLFSALEAFFARPVNKIWHILGFVNFLSLLSVLQGARPQLGEYLIVVLVNSLLTYLLLKIGQRFTNSSYSYYR